MIESPITIVDLTQDLLTPAFFETLSNLRETSMTPEKAQAILAERERQGTRTYVALKNGEVVGTASLVIETKFLHNGGIVGHVEDVATRKGFEGQGIGRALMDHVNREATGIGCYKVILDCVPEMKPFYAKCGYQDYGTQMRWNPA